MTFYVIVAAFCAGIFVSGRIYFFAFIIVVFLRASIVTFCAFFDMFGFVDRNTGFGMLLCLCIRTLTAFRCMLRVADRGAAEVMGIGIREITYGAILLVL